ncbi:TetR/AcrR family transcriptional regulator [Qipengyuania sp. XHP0207]|uniref:TetR/AcrR family transcriptional regulator n=1 Tax=Qipengyuania sp. XHP0207 TaxID=3038078 RepID=UPI00241C6A5B|nr:TetR/AcrR family transcriptional regulator [Qipengyuania sp. XHP0207]MDG5746823.1 TetR/AcrR family transcriptional regulator [Qipengyuania sp. XHP0207]
MSSPASTRKFDEKREAIIHAASVLINEVGVQATTLAEVARAIGLNATSVTYYFPRKEQLVVAVYDETLTLMEEIAQAALDQPDPAARLRHFIASQIALRKRIRAGERGLTTALSEIRTLEPESYDTLMAHYLRVVGVVRRFFGEWSGNAQRALFSARAHILLEAMMWWPVWSLRYSVRDFDRIEERLFDVLASGLPSERGRFAPQDLGGDWRTGEGEEGGQNEAFLRAATVMINRLGYRGASVNRIAESLNVTKGSFYHHHQAKDDLVLACFQQSYDRLSAVQMAGLGLGGDYWTRIASVMRELVDLQFFDATPLLRTTALQALEADHKEDVVTRSNRLARRFAGMLIDGIADGSVRPIDPLIAGQVIMSTVNSAYDAHHWAERFEDRDAATRTYLRVLSEGMLADPR